jgi:hypothetical protein
MISRGLVSRWLRPAGALALGLVVCATTVLALGPARAMAAGPECTPVSGETEAQEHIRKQTEERRKEGNVNPSPAAEGKTYSQLLPDCRAYEMVSPLDKQTHPARPAGGYGLLVGPDGGGVGYISEGEFAEPQNSDVSVFFPYNVYLSQRGSAEWLTSSSFAPAGLVPFPDLSGLAGDFSPNLSSQVTCGSTPTGTGESVTANTTQGFACARCIKPPTATAVSNRCPTSSWVSAPAKGGAYPTLKGSSLVQSETYLGASEDLSRVFFQPHSPLLPTDTLVSANSDGIYEIAGLGTTAPRMRLVNVDNNGRQLVNLAEEVSGPQLVGPYLGDWRNDFEVHGSSYQAIARDGRTVFFTATPSAEQGQQPAGEQRTIYARLHCVTPSSTCKEDNEGYEPPDKSHELLETIPVSNPVPSQCTTCSPTALPTTFQGASADGTKVFFTTNQQLLNSDTDETTDLYEYDVTERRLIQISAGITNGGHIAGAGADVAGVVRTSHDGSHVYFVALGKLTTDKNTFGEEAQEGKFNLYGYDTVTGQIKFITINGGGDVGGITISTDQNRHAQTNAPDGRYLVFSTVPSGKLREATSQNEALAAYRYDFNSGELTWVSGGAPGFTRSPSGEGKSAFIASLPRGIVGAAADIENWSRALSENGEDIIFTTSEKLQANDVNKAPDVYEWRCASPCEHPAAEGIVHLISDGQSAKGADTGLETEDSPVSGMSSSGSDIFFLSQAQLVGQDTDTLPDVYDARVNGGFKAPEVTGCSGSSCQPEPSTHESFSSALSSLGHASGNLAPPTGGVVGFQTSKPSLTRAQLLARALKACKSERKRKARITCESRAKKKYASKAKAKTHGAAKKGVRGGR